MDGLDDRGQVLVIGATNRVDNLDEALRRPGRFDKEFYFPLPDMAARRKMLFQYTAKWSRELGDDMADYIAHKTLNFSGADIREFCSQALAHSIRRLYPHIYAVREKLEIDVEHIIVEKEDFDIVLKCTLHLQCQIRLLTRFKFTAYVPTCRRLPQPTWNDDVPPLFKPLFNDHVDNCLIKIAADWPVHTKERVRELLRIERLAKENLQKIEDKAAADKIAEEEKSKVTAETQELLAASLSKESLLPEGDYQPGAAPEASICNNQEESAVPVQEVVKVTEIIMNEKKKAELLLARRQVKVAAVKKVIESMDISTNLVGRSFISQKIFSLLYRF